MPDPKTQCKGTTQAVVPFFRAGNVYVPPGSIAPWVKEYVHETTTFPGSSKDDQVDATSQALQFLLVGDEDEDSALANWRIW